MSLTPSGVVVGLLHPALTGIDARGFPHAIVNRREVLSRL